MAGALGADQIKALLGLTRHPTHGFTVGSDLAAGLLPQLFIPRDTFHTGRPRTGATYVRLATTAWSGVESSDVERGDHARLQAAYPAMADDIARFMG